MKISKRKIELLLAEKRITSSTLAELSGLSRQSVSAIKQRGTCNPTTAAKLAKGLCVDVAEIIEKED